MDHYCAAPWVTMKYQFLFIIWMGLASRDLLLGTICKWRAYYIAALIYLVAAVIEECFEFDEVQGVVGSFFRRVFAFWRNDRAEHNLQNPHITRPLSRAQQRKIAPQKLSALVYFTDEELGALGGEKLKGLVEKFGSSSGTSGTAFSTNLTKEEMVKNIPHRTAATGDHCTVCQKDFTPGMELVALSCGHAFHRYCIISWFANRMALSKPVTCHICDA